MHVVIFEGSYWSDFAPLSFVRPVFMLRCGAGTLLERIIRATRPTRLTLWVRPEMEAMVNKTIVPTLKIPVSVNTPLDEEKALLVNARTVHFAEQINGCDECVTVEEGTDMVRMAHVSRPGWSHTDVFERSDRWQRLRDLKKDAPQARFAHNLCDLIAWNEEALLADSIHWTEPAPAGDMFHIVRPENVHARGNVSIAPGVVLDASGGPIMIDEHSKIGANAVIEGPCHFGPHVVISPQAVIRAGTSIGPLCKVGGEVGHTIFLGHSNKAHDGYVGHSYLGEWVNLGAGTTASNLKSTYGPIRMKIGPREIETGRMFLGTLFGDHVKTSIGMLLPAGTYVGTCTMMGSLDPVPKFTPSFVFWSDTTREKYHAEKAIEVARRMTGRRHVEWTNVESDLLHYAQSTAREIEGEINQ